MRKALGRRDRLARRGASTGVNGRHEAPSSHVNISVIRRVSQVVAFPIIDTHALKRELSFRNRPAGMAAASFGHWQIKHSPKDAFAKRWN
ncbi:hypothetical protein Bxe_A3725 [Paraburkholderia xenovorans LB400]|uniref:Uncharacterized protein n=1 Tax=Paraburkholderia xenovorans (strain LB400) TaxID=266265 RepID=Q144H5_PARXL|nr:hypothetical protein Bxe_A3725 [Paraburkholderia xenovorans LB400]